ncbi:uncharacterized protein [Antedon mediterranea]|uniref:uncharacterized protein isoform X2 n=1 Tax=Antedon mediterranea TaxID=105859 RepID=UPI003AF9207C
MKTLDSVRAPLKLAHDDTPMDVSVLMLGQNHQIPFRDEHRFKGFPAHNFSEATKPLIGPPPEDDDFLNRSFRKKQHFVKGMPPNTKHENVPGRVTDPVPDNTLEYGSNRLAPSRVEPVPLKTLFYKEGVTSAENRKREAQLKDAMEDIARNKTVKMEKQLTAREEKKRDLQMLIDYKPWGKPGGGAPKPDQNIRTKAVDATVLHNGKSVEKFLTFGKPGHGAPLRTSSGNPITSIRANNDIRFCDLKGMKETVNNHARYAMPCKDVQSYAEELGNMALAKKTQREIERYQEKQEEKETWKHDPFGMPGGGAPIKTNSGKLQTRHNITLINDQKEMRDTEERHQRKNVVMSNRNDTEVDSTFVNKRRPLYEKEKPYDPWGKGSGAPKRDEKGRLMRHTWGNELGVTDFIDPSATGGALETKSFGGGGVNVDERGEKRTKFSVTLDHDRTGEPILKESDRTKVAGGFDPWGKPGGGAPLKDEKGKKATTISGKMMTDKFGYERPKFEELRAKQEYLSELQNGISEQQQLRKSLEDEMKQAGNEVGPWIREKEVGYPKKDPITGVLLPKQHKGASDVTKQRMDIRRPARPSQVTIYSSDLERQAMERQLNKAVEKQFSRDLSAQHHANFERVWGKPGNGAPKATNNRLSLDMERDYQGDRQYQAPWKQPHATIQVKKPWARTTALENRFNRYSEQNLPQRAVPVRAPWATYSLQ